MKKEYYNPAKEQFPEGYKDWQFKKIRKALKRYIIYCSGDNQQLSQQEVAKSISDYTGESIKKDAISRLLSGYYGKDEAGNWVQPKLPNMHAITSYLIDPDVDCGLRLQDLKKRQDGYDIPTELSRFFVKPVESISTDEEIIRYKKLCVTYNCNIKENEEKKSITLYLSLPENGEFFIAREEIKPVDTNDETNEKCSTVKKEKKLCYDGWGLIMPEGYVFFLMKDTNFDHNHLIITSNEFNFSATNTAPQEFFAVIRDKGINCCDPSNHTGYIGFCNMLSNVIIFRKQN